MLSPRGPRQPISDLRELRQDKLPASDINANFLPKINYLYQPAFDPMSGQNFLQGDSSMSNPNGTSQFF